MSRSVLLQLVRDSIQEVFQANRTIEKAELLKEHPLLCEPINLTIKLTIEKELKGSFSSNNTETSLLENIIIGAKKAAFEDVMSSVLTTSEYLHSDIELILHTPDGKINEIDKAIIALPI